mmetsp:Transcript_14150/g.24765  ORF Transcript_14150/g.24765 Transcript_14150/m.24765 type:complete len:112 (-) Transcript_14150:121-456(-)
MKLVAALLLAQLGGNAAPGEADIKKILSSVGVEADAEQLARLLSEVAGKDLNALIAEGKTKLASLPAAGPSSSAAPAAGAAAPAAGAAAAKKVEKKEDTEEEEDMGFSLFD